MGNVCQRITWSAVIPNHVAGYQGLDMVPLHLSIRRQLKRSLRADLKAMAYFGC